MRFLLELVGVRIPLFWLHKRGLSARGAVMGTNYAIVWNPLTIIRFLWSWRGTRWAR
jgi:hypothetical protein